MAAAGLFGRGKHPPDVVEQSGIGRKIAARSSANRLLLDDDEPLNMFQSSGDLSTQGHNGLLKFVDLGLRWLRPLPESVGQLIDQKLTDQAGLSGSGYPGNRGENTQRNIGIQCVEIVSNNVAKMQPFLWCSDRP